MAITKAQAIELSESGQWFHYGHCTRTVGPRGGITDKIIQVRPVEVEVEIEGEE